MSKSNKKYTTARFGDLKVGDEFSECICGKRSKFIKTTNKRADSLYVKSSWPFDADEQVEVAKK